MDDGEEEFDPMDEQSSAQEMQEMGDGQLQQEADGGVVEVTDERCVLRTALPFSFFIR